MEKAESKDINSTVAELKKKLGLNKIPVIHPSIEIKKDSKHLYKVAGFFYPLRPETLERLNIPPQKILFEVDREQWHKEQDEANEKRDKTIDPEQYPLGYEK